MKNGIHEMINWDEELRYCNKNLPDSARGLFKSNAPVVADEILRRAVEESEIHNTQIGDGDYDTFDHKPIPNLHGKWADGEMVFSMESAIDARVLYQYATTMLLPGEVNMVVDYDARQYSVHVIPSVIRDKPNVIRAMMDEFEYIG